MNQQMIGTGLRKRGEISLRFHDHQMHIQRLARAAPQCFDNHRTEGDIRHEPAIHYVDMNPIRAGGVDGLNLFGKPGKIS